MKDDPGLVIISLLLQIYSSARNLILLPCRFLCLDHTFYLAHGSRLRHGGVCF